MLYVGECARVTRCSITTMASEPRPSLLRIAGRRWRETAAATGTWHAARELAADLWEFLRESTPERRRGRYGDIDYDFDSGADTTAANVDWRTRLAAALSGAPYQPSEPMLFRKMMRALPLAPLEAQGFTFIDLGSGKGRALLLAADEGFARVLGIEIVPALHAAALANIRSRIESQRASVPTQVIESHLGDARDLELPPGPLVIYLFNPLTEAALAAFIAQLEGSLADSPRPVFILYHNPLLEHVLARSAALMKLGGTHQYVIYRSR